MPASEALDNFRKADYGKKKDEPAKEGMGAEGRAIELSDDELKGIGYQDGMEVKCTVTGRLDGKTIHVTSVESQEPMAEDEDMQEVAGVNQKAPVMRPQTMPYPS